MNSKTITYSSVLGIVIANKRREFCIEQSTIAEALGISQASYSRLESGKSTFSVDQMFGCAKALKISIGALIRAVSNTVDRLEQEPDVQVESQVRGQPKSSGTGTFLAGAALGALLVGLAGKSNNDS